MKALAREEYRAETTNKPGKATRKRFTTQETLVLYLLAEYSDYTRFHVRVFEDGMLCVYEYGIDKTDCFSNLSELLSLESSLGSLLMRLEREELTKYQPLTDKTDLNTKEFVHLLSQN